MSAGGSGGTLPGVFAVIWSPVRTLRRVAREGRAFPGFVVVALYAALSLIISTAFVLLGATRQRIEQQSRPGIPPGVEDALVRATEVGTLVFAVLSPFLVWVSVSLLMHLATGLFGGTGPLSSMFGVVGVAQAPLLVSGVVGAGLTGLQALAGAGSAVGAVLGYLVFLVGVLFFLWYVVLVVIGASLVRGVGYGESAASCALSCVGLAVLIIFLVVVAGIGIFAAAGAAAP